MLVVLTRSCTLNMVSQHGISFSFSQAFIEAFVGFEVGSLFNHVLSWDVNHKNWVQQQIWNEMLFELLCRCQCPLCCDNHQTFDLIWIWLRHWEQIHSTFKNRASYI
jgi:hypothetical protein